MRPLRLRKLRRRYMIEDALMIAAVACVVVVIVLGLWL